MLTVQQEPWLTVRSSLMPIWTKHHAAIADARDAERVPLAPDWAKYDAYAERGSLHIVVARSAGEIVGYVFAVVDTHLHYRTTLCGFYDIYWLDPEHRKGRGLSLMRSNGVLLFREAEQTLKARGVQKLFAGTKVWHDAAPIFAAMGWTEAERLYTKYIGD